jgi:hypothetical protein
MKAGLGRTAFAGAAFAIAMAVPALTSAGANTSVDETRLPVGKTVKAATVGGLWTCQADNANAAGGANAAGPWFNADGTWNLSKKLAVSGSVSWPAAKVTVTKSGGTIKIVSNDLPTIHTTGVFPIASSDAVYPYDKNPSTIKAQSLQVELTTTPTVQSTPTCIPGEVGILKDGVALFDAADAGGRDAVAYEAQDHCQGHPMGQGEYHYHKVSTCVLAKYDTGTGQSKQVGWAYDGFGIFGPRDAKGKVLTTADLDACHGITSKVKFNGKVQKIYHYVATVDYPYTVGCFRGKSTLNGPSVGGGGGGPGGGPPGP